MLNQIPEFAANNPLLVIAFLVLLVLVFLNEFKIATQRFSSLTPAGAVQLMNNEDVVVLDVREPSETAGGMVNRGCCSCFRTAGLGSCTSRSMACSGSAKALLRRVRYWFAARAMVSRLNRAER